MKDSGEIYAFGRNDKGQLGIDTNLQALIQPKQITDFLSVNLSSSSGNQNQMHNTQQEESMFSENVQYVSRKVSITKIACGCYHSIALSGAGQVFTFGRGNHGQLGHGNTED
mmetsp:Transcript_35953/g.26707  ORF Transcript_35953/g.26707 Transcript_35953/m.26707 type:complete len:112 (+) Transcript_35953:42-377(+)